MSKDEQLMRAVMNGDQEAAIDAIKSGASIFTKTSKGNGLLFLAASRSQKDMFDWLLTVEQNGKKINIDERNNEGATILFECLKDVTMNEFVKPLLQNGANPNIHLLDGTSLLIHACAFKMEDMVDLLLEHKVEVNYFTEDTRTNALMTAANQPSISIVKKLIEANADIHFLDGSNRNVLIATLMRGDSFLKKKEKKEYAELCNYLCTLDFNYDQVASSGMTAFWAASLNKLMEPCMLMLGKGVNPNVWHEIGIDMGITSALHLWCQQSNESSFDLIREMVKCGAKLGVPDAHGNMPETFGFIVPKLRQLMLDLNADVNAFLYIKDKKDKVYKTPVVSSIINDGDKQLEMIKEMIKRGVNFNFQEDKNIEKNPVLTAISAGAINILKEIINTKQIDINKEITIPNGYQTITPLMTLVSEEQNSQFKTYLEQKGLLTSIKEAEKENKKNGVKSELLSDEDLKEVDDKLAEILSIENQLKDKKLEMFNLLMGANADVNQLNDQKKNALFFVKTDFFTDLLLKNKADIEHQDLSGNNAFIHSFLSGKKDVIETMKNWLNKNQKEMLSSLYYDIAFLDIQSSVQQGLLEKSIISYIDNQIDKEKFFKEKEYKANVDFINYQDSDGNSPALIGCANNLPFLVSLYRRMGADLDLKNNLDETPIMHAIATKNTKLIDFLIENKVNLESKTKDGKNVLDFALETNDLSIIESIKIGLGHAVAEGSISGNVKLKR